MYNEEQRVMESIGPLLDFMDAQPRGSRLVFVDDGSTDRTVEVVGAELDRRGTRIAEVVRCSHAGKGAAIRAGLRTADGDVAAFCDVDLATPLDELARIADVAAAERCLAIGSRVAKGAAIGHHEERRRELAGKAYNKLVRAWLCPGVSDTQCGAKAAPSASWRSVLPYSREDGFAWDVEVIALARRLGIPVREVGIRWNHDSRTRVRVLHDGSSMVTAVPRIAIRVRRVRHVEATVPFVAPATAGGDLAS
jgi:dolichyl-phosphate beta-glucosyltransferase